jgi:mRNA interferase MazF
MRRGEVRWCKSSPPDKKRPVLLLTRDTILEYLGEVTVAPITSMIRDIPSEVVLCREDGMLQDCAINCDHIQTVSKSEPPRRTDNDFVRYQDARGVPRRWVCPGLWWIRSQWA